jgi:hypothetical protein
MDWVYIPKDSVQIEMYEYFRKQNGYKGRAKRLTWDYRHEYLTNLDYKPREFLEVLTQMQIIKESRMQNAGVESFEKFNELLASSAKTLLNAPVFAVGAAVEAGRRTTKVIGDGGSFVVGSTVNAGRRGVLAIGNSSRFVAGAAVNAGQTTTNVVVNAGKSAANATLNAGKMTTNATLNAGKMTTNAVLTAGKMTTTAALNAGKMTTYAVLNAGKKTKNVVGISGKALVKVSVKVVTLPVDLIAWKRTVTPEMVAPEITTPEMVAPEMAAPEKPFIAGPPPPMTAAAMYS